MEEYKKIQFLVPKWYEKELSVIRPDSGQAAQTDVFELFNGSNSTCSLNVNTNDSIFEVKIDFASNKVDSKYVWIDGFRSLEDLNLIGSFSIGSGSNYFSTTQTGSLFKILESPASSSQEDKYTVKWQPSGLNETKNYALRNITISDEFIVPLYDQNYSVELSYMSTPYQNKNYLDLIFPKFTIADKLLLIERQIISWSGLLEDEKDIFIYFLNAQVNSFQPFIMLKWTGETTYEANQYIISANSANFNRDSANLWNVSFEMIKINSEDELIFLF